MVHISGTVEGYDGIKEQDGVRRWVEGIVVRSSSHQGDWIIG